MQPRFVVDDVFDQLLPHGAVKKGAAVDGFIDQFGSLGKNTAASNGVVTDFGIPHIAVIR